MKIILKAAKYYVVYRVIDAVAGGRVSKAVSVVTTPIINGAKRLGDRISG